MANVSTVHTMAPTTAPHSAMATGKYNNIPYPMTERRDVARLYRIPKTDKMEALPES